jgi:hypothetical protein
MADENQSAFKVTDRRLFNADGSLRDDAMLDNPYEPTLGLGEASVGPTGAAIGNAVARALGRRIRDLPLTRERIVATLLSE